MKQLKYYLISLFYLCITLGLFTLQHFFIHQIELSLLRIDILAFILLLPVSIFGLIKQYKMKDIFLFIVIISILFSTILSILLMGRYDYLINLSALLSIPFAYTIYFIINEKDEKNLHYSLIYTILLALIISLRYQLVPLPSWMVSPNFIPFVEYLHAISIKDMMTDIVINLILFIPLTVFLTCRKVSFLSLFKIIGISSISLEIYEYATCFGIPSINDVIINILGAIIIYLVINRFLTIKIDDN